MLLRLYLTIQKPFDIMDMEKGVAEKRLRPVRVS